MAQTVQSLFGLTPEQIQAQRAAEVDARALQYAQMDPFQRAEYGIFRGASQLGDVLAQRLGYVDPLVKQAEERKGLLSGMNITDPNSLRAAAQKAWQGGQFDVAQTLLEQANTGFEEERKRAKAEREATIESNRLAGATQFIKRRIPDITDMEAEALAADKEALKKLLENPTIKTQVVEANGRSKLIDSTTGETIKDLGEAPQRGTRVSVGGPVIDTRGKAFEKADTEALTTYRTEARAAGGQIGLINQAREAINYGAVAGTGIPGIVRGFNNVLAPLGINTNAVANTRSLEQALNSIIAQGIKQYGSNPSTADLEFAKQAAANVKDPKAAITQTLNYLEKRASLLLEKQNAAEEWLYNNNNLAGFEKAWAKQQSAVLKGKAGKTSSGTNYEIIED